MRDVTASPTAPVAPPTQMDVSGATARNASQLSVTALL